MIRCFLFLFLFLFQSCFLFNKFKKSKFTYTENGVSKQSSLVVPKRFKKIERLIDSSGNEQQVYRYRGGALLYFAHATDTLKEFQPIDYEMNIPGFLYGSTFFKGIDNTNRYWRENRNHPYRAGYRYVLPGKDWRFDSALNYFSLQPK